MNRTPRFTIEDRPSAFTLIEALVVISIIAVLLTVLVPALRHARGLARAAACMASQSQFGVAFRLYAEDWNYYLPPTNSTGKQVDRWYVLIRPYVGKSPFSTDQEFHAAVWDDGYTDEFVGFRTPGLSCPTREVYNPEDGSSGPFGINLDAVVGLGTSSRLTHLPMTTYVLADSYGYYNYSPQTWPFDWDEDLDGINDTNTNVNPPSQSHIYYNNFRPRHPVGSFTGSVDRRGGNFLFWDGHVDYLMFREWLNNKDDLWGGTP